MIIPKWPIFISLRRTTHFRHSYRFFSQTGTTPRICVVGSGPAGFYTAQLLLKRNSNVTVDIFEKMPVPFGLVRYGVAPDHPEVKNATNSFEETARNPRCRFFGNVNVGSDIKFSELRAHYDGVVFAYGADDDKKLNIPGEDANGVYAARTFVGWYNGLPAHADLAPNLNCNRAVIIGQGNVALDVARMLLAPAKLLQPTDISSHALEVLVGKSSVRNVSIVGRRSPLEVSFTIKELRELIRLPDVQALLRREDFVHIKPLIPTLPIQRRRLIDLMCKTALDPPQKDESKRHWELDFLSSPVEILTDSSNNVTGIRMERNKLVERQDGTQSAVGTGEYTDVECGIVLRSIGYKSIHLEEGIPFDKRLGVIPNIEGRVVEEPSSESVVKGLYCSGWVKHGPVGVIATTMNEAFATAENIVQDIETGLICSTCTSRTDVGALLSERGVRYITFEEYGNIDQEELWRGMQQQKEREKIVSTSEMLDIALGTPPKKGTTSSS